MGDMADFIIENGILSQFYEDPDPREGTTTCKYCSEDILVWGNIGSKKKPIWRLHNEDGTLHSCKHKEIK
jgi:hypothetical protein